MPAQKPAKLRLGASASALSIASEPPMAVQPRLAAGEESDTRSQEALSRLNQAVAELKALTVAPLLRRAWRRSAEDDQDRRPAGHRGLAA